MYDSPQALFRNPYYTQVFAHFESSHVAIREAAGEFVNLVRYLSYSLHIFATTAPPGGVHIFAWPASFRKFAPRACIFLHTIPVCEQRVKPTQATQVTQSDSRGTLPESACETYYPFIRLTCGRTFGIWFCVLVLRDAGHKVQASPETLPYLPSAGLWVSTPSLVAAGIVD